MSNIVTTQAGLLPTPAEWTMLKEQAGMYVKSGLLPTTVNTAEKAIVIAMKGRELGIPPLQAFSHIHVVQGKPAISAELMMALIYRNCPGAVIDFVETNETRCVLKAKRPGSSKAVEFKFTIEDARRAELLGKGPWKQYPAAMIRARCISSMARALFPDAIMGCSYTPEELGAEINGDGEVAKDVSEAPMPEPTKQDLEASAQAVFGQDTEVFDPSSYVIQVGKKYKGKRLGNIPVTELESYKRYFDDEMAKGASLTGNAAEAYGAICQYLEVERKDNFKH